MADRDDRQSTEDLERWRALEANATDAISEISEDARLLWMTPSFTAVFGWQPGEVLGKDVLQLVHPDDRPSVDSVRAQAMAETRSAQLRFRFLHKDGSWRWIELTGRPYVTEAGERRALLISRDVSERVAAEREVERQRSAEMRIMELSRRFLAVPSEDFETGMRDALAGAAAIAGADRVQFASIGPDQRVDAYWRWDAQGPDSEVPDLSRALRDHRLSVRLLLAGEVFHVPDVDDVPPEGAPEQATMRGEGLLSYLSVPIRVDGWFGFLDFSCRQRKRCWTDQEIGRLRLLGEVFASALTRQRADEARLGSEERFRMLAEQARDCICELAPDGKLLYISPRTAEISGYSFDELLRIDPLSLVHPDDLEQVAKGFRVAVDGSTTKSYRVRHRDGHWVPVEASMRRFRHPRFGERIALVIRDASESSAQRQALERQLAVEKAAARFSRELLARPVGELDLAIRRGLEAAASIARADRSYLIATLEGTRHSFDWKADGVSERPHKFGPAGGGIMKWALRRLSRGELLRLSSRGELPDDSALREELERTGIRSLLVIPVRIKRRLVGILGFHCTGQETQWSDHEITVLRLIAELFTSALRRKESERELERSQRQLLQAQKMEAVGTLAGGIAHDFNNQLTVMLGNARFVLRQAEDPESIDALQDLVRAAEHCAQLTRSLLAFSRRTSVTPEVVDVHRVLAESRELLRPLIPTSIAFDMPLPETTACVRADPVQLQQVLINLAVNARDAMPDGGHLRVSVVVRKVEVGAARRLGLTRGGPHVEISVADTGTGIDEAVQARMFEPFYTTKPPGGGTGLGLATAYGIVHDCGGAIEVESEVGHGSTFRILLPVSDEEQTGSHDDESDAAPAGRGTVLLAEDEDRVRRILRRGLESGGYAVLEAADGVAALQALASHAGPIELLVSDIDMPRMGGVELARRARQARPQLRVLFVSGSHPDPRDDPAGAAPSARFLQKPFDETALLAAVRDALAR